jgi:hypothetical protein
MDAFALAQIKPLTHMLGTRLREDVLLLQEISGISGGYMLSHQALLGSCPASSTLKLQAHIEEIGIEVKRRRVLWGVAKAFTKLFFLCSSSKGALDLMLTSYV